MPNSRQPDRFRIIAILVVLIGIIYFNLSVFAPSLIPKTLRVGSQRKPVNLLILGLDTSFNDVTGEPITGINTRTDTMLFVRLNPIKNRLDIFSIPRDTYVDIPGHGMSKINAANVYGGPELVRQTVSGLLDRPIDYYLEIRPEALVKLVNLLGGVEIEVEKEMRYVDTAQGLNINLKQGKQKLNGQQANDYIRFRHDAMGDIGRIARQQTFFKALKKTMGRPSNLVKAPAILQALLANINTNMPLATSVRLITYARTMSYDKINPITISGEAADLPGAGSVWLPNHQMIRRVMNEI